MRYKDIQKKYTRHGGLWKEGNNLFEVGEQMQYEWEQDFIAMRWAIDYLVNGGKSGPQLALNVLLKRVSEFSCPCNLKDEYKTPERCPLKNNCKCKTPHPMTPEQIKANEIIYRHRKILSVYYHPIVAQHASIDFAVSDVEDKIALLNEMLETNLHNDFDILNRRGEYLAILQELKNMNQ